MEVIGIVLSLFLLMYMAYLGFSVILFSPIFALLAAVMQGMPLMPSYTELFMAKAVVDGDEFVNADATAKGGDAAQGKQKYEDVCTYCHGPEGNAINFASIEEPEFVGHVAADNPWEFVPKVRFGQPGWPMP